LSNQDSISHVRCPCCSTPSPLALTISHRHDDHGLSTDLHPSAL
jgi:hypothetical protein